MKELSLSPVKIADAGLCIGCGACTYASTRSSMAFDVFGLYKPQLDSNKLRSESFEQVCPFSDEGPHEDELAEELFGDNEDAHESIGRSIKCFAGYVQEANFRAKGSSGGITTWLAVELLERNMVDAVIHVGRQSSSVDLKPIYAYRISTTIDEVKSNSCTKYYPITLDPILREIKGADKKRYLFIGIPCFVKTIRRLCKVDEAINERIKYTISLFCGHLKSHDFTGKLINETYPKLKEFSDHYYRVKDDTIPADRYVSGVSDMQNIMKTLDWTEISGAEWNTGSFKYPACNFCDDVVGETADVSIGDAWLPRFRKDSGGTNALIVRNRSLLTIIEEAGYSARLSLVKLTSQEVADSQRGGLTDRREGLSYRLHLFRVLGEYVPLKRVKPANTIPSRRKGIYLLKLIIQYCSHLAYLEQKRVGLPNYYRKRMAPLYAAYDRRYLRALISLPLVQALMELWLGRLKKRFSKISGHNN